MHTHGLEEFVRIVVSGSREDRKQVSHLYGNVTSKFECESGHARKLLESYLCEEQGVVQSSQMAVSLLLRLLFALVPKSAVGYAVPDFESLARISLRQKLNVDCSEEMVRQFAVIIKRVRFVHFNGREGATKLDLSRGVHKRLLREQQGRCGVCLYTFREDVDYYAYEDDSVLFLENHTPVKDELVLGKYYRRPELDHIIPYLFGGDRKSNWQILCRSCNSGKSNWLTFGFSASSIGRIGLEKVTKLSPATRYIVLSRDYDKVRRRLKESPGEMSQDGKEVRVFGRDADLLDSVDNLEARYC